MEPRQADPRFLQVLDEIIEMHRSKGTDYGSETDHFANVRASEEFGVDGWIGAIIRANDKMQRLKTFTTHGELVHESVEDSLLDLANYVVIALVLWRERGEKIL